MKFYSCLAAAQEPNVRGRLLQRTLRQYCSGNRQAFFTETLDIHDGTHPVSLLESLSAYPKSKHSLMAFFNGMVNAPEAHMGRNVLVCAQPLQTELAMFAARNNLDTATGPMWWRNVLRNFERVIMLDRHSLAQSAGFAPWARLSLSDHFPVILSGGASQRDKSKVLILNHDPAACAKEIFEIHRLLSDRAEIVVLANDAAQPVDLDVIATAAVHIHCGYDNHTAASGLTPFDSLSNGVYTVVLPARTEATADAIRREVDPRIVKEVKSRSYAQLAEDVEDVGVFVDRALDRLDRFAREGLAINPELQRFDRLNEEYISRMLARFTKQVRA